MAMTPFDFGGKKIRTEVIDSNPWFAGKDVCDILGYKDPTNAIKQHCRGVVKHHPIEDNLGRIQETRIINEPDLYRLIANSKLPSAVKFEKWVFEEMIPTVRKTGGVYLTHEKAELILSDPEVIIGIALQVIELRAAVAHKDQQIEQRDLLIEEAAPAVAYVGTLTESNASMLVGDFAKVLVKAGIKTGRNRLLKWFRRKGYLLKQSGSKNHPSQYSTERGLFEMKPVLIKNPGKKDIQKMTTYMTGKGQMYFYKKITGAAQKRTRPVKNCGASPQNLN